MDATKKASIQYDTAESTLELVSDGPEGSISLMTGEDSRIFVSPQGRVGVGTQEPQAQLDVVSTVSGFLPPRLSEEERDAISDPPEGLMIFNTDSGRPEFFDGTDWQSMRASGSGGGGIEGGVEGSGAGVSLGNLAIIDTDQTIRLQEGVTYRILAMGAGGGGGARRSSGGFTNGANGGNSVLLEVTPSSAIDLEVVIGQGGAGGNRTSAGTSSGSAGGSTTLKDINTDGTLVDITVIGGRGGRSSSSSGANSANPANVLSGSLVVTIVDMLAPASGASPVGIGSAGGTLLNSTTSATPPSSPAPGFPYPVFPRDAWRALSLYLNLPLTGGAPRNRGESSGQTAPAAPPFSGGGASTTDTNSGTTRGGLGGNGAVFIWEKFESLSLEAD